VDTAEHREHEARELCIPSAMQEVSQFLLLPRFRLCASELVCHPVNLLAFSSSACDKLVEALSIAPHLTQITEILTNQTRSLEEIRAQLEGIVSAAPVSRSLLEDLINGTSASLLASNIIEVIRLVLGRS